MSKQKRQYEFLHVERLGTDEVDGILVGKCYVFPKIDGSSGSIYTIDYNSNNLNGEMIFCSRHRIVTIDDDNQGFVQTLSGATGTSNHKTALKLDYFFEAHPDLILHGEWLVPHTLKTYRPEAWKRFYIYAVQNKNGQYLHYDEYKHFEETYFIDSLISFIPPLQIITNPTEEQILYAAKNNHYLLNETDVGEGIVLYNYQFTNKYNRFAVAKLVLSEFKDKFRSVQGAPELENHLIEADLAEKYCTLTVCEKEYEKIRNTNDGWKSSFIPQLLSTIYHTIITEEIWNMINKGKQKNPTIDFKRLQQFINAKIKENLPHLF